MKLISLNVGRPQTYEYKGQQGYTSIFKKPVEGPAYVSENNIEGDEQSDLSVHGGTMKAVYAYDISYYHQWKQILPRSDWTYGMFGENLTTEHLRDDHIQLGNVYQVGSVLLKAVQPRFPCLKLNVRFNDSQMVRHFTRQQNNGTYFSVEQPGYIQQGDAITLREQSTHDVTIQQMVCCYNNRGADKKLLKKIIAIDFLPVRLHTQFSNFLK